MTTYTKLQSGAWGVRGEGSPPAVGARVTVTKKSGETKTETIECVVWSGQGKWIAAVAPSSAPRASGRRSREDWEELECELCGKNKYKCGHCIGW